MFFYMNCIEPIHWTPDRVVKIFFISIKIIFFANKSSIYQIQITLNSTQVLITVIVAVNLISQIHLQRMPLAQAKRLCQRIRILQHPSSASQLESLKVILGFECDAVRTRSH